MVRELTLGEGRLPNFYQQLDQVLQQQPVVVATIVRTRGSAPREVGAKMGIYGNGEIIDTIGGGAGEAKVIQQALTVLKTGEKQLVEIDLSGIPGRQTEGVCGGWMQVCLEVWTGEASIALVQQVLAVLQLSRNNAELSTLVIPLTSNTCSYVTSEFATLTAPTIATISCESGQTEALLEPLVAPPLLLIVGAGHVAVPLAQIAHLAGFQIAVQDDRPEFASTDRFPARTKVFTNPVDTILEKLAAPNQLYVALVTRGYQHDLAALTVLLSQSPQPHYIGMIGSQKRVHTVFQALQLQGIDLARLQHIHAPIGLDIGALTPAEIAVSICAELIQVRRGGTGQPLSIRSSQFALTQGNKKEQVDYAIVLAAGLSTRMGSCKAALPWQKGRTLLSYQIEQLLQVGITPIVVLGPHNAHLQTLCSAPCRSVINPAPEEGKTSSIRLGLAAIGEEARSIMISAVDQPRPALIYEQLLKSYAQTDALITAPTYQQKMGHPIIFSARMLPHLTTISEQTLGLRQIMQQWAGEIQTVEFDTALILADLNTPAIYQAFQTN